MAKFTCEKNSQWIATHALQNTMHSHDLNTLCIFLFEIFVLLRISYDFKLHIYFSLFEYVHSNFYMFLICLLSYEYPWEL